MSVHISPDGASALSVSHDSRLALYSTTTSSAPIRFAEKAHLSSTYSTAPVWLPSSGVGASGSPRIALGSSSGAVVVWDTVRATVSARLNAGAKAEGARSSGTGAVRALAVGKAGSGVSAAAGDDAASAGSVTLLISQENASDALLAWDCIASSAGASAQKPILRSLPLGVSRSAPASVATRIAAQSSGRDGAGQVVFAATAGGIAVVETATGRRFGTLAGHALPPTGISLSEDETILVTCAGERTLHLWDVRSLAGAKANGLPISPTAVLLHPETPRPDGLSITRATPPSKSSKKAVYHVASVGDGGAVAVWRFKRTPLGDGEEGKEAPTPLSLRPGGMVHLAEGGSGGGGGLNAERRVLLAARLVSIAGVHDSGVWEGLVTAGGAGAGGVSPPEPEPLLVCAAGPIAAPSFYVVRYVDAEHPTRLQSDVVLEGASDVAPARSAATAPMVTSVVVAAKSTLARGQKDESGGAALTGSKRARADSSAAASAAGDSAILGANDEAADDVAAENMTLGQKLRGVVAALAAAPSHELGVASEGGGGGGAVLSGPVTTASLASALTQALQSGDDAALDSALSAGQGRRGAARALVTSTMARLGAGASLPLLSAIVRRLAARPSRAAALFPWARALLTAHAPTLLAQPNVAGPLESLYALVDSRLSGHAKLRRLAGKLELLLAMSTTRVVPASGEGESESGGRTTRLRDTDEDDLVSDDASEGDDDGMDEAGGGGEDGEDDGDADFDDDADEEGDAMIDDISDDEDDDN